MREQPGSDGAVTVLARGAISSVTDRPHRLAQPAAARLSRKRIRRYSAARPTLVWCLRSKGVREGSFAPPSRREHQEGRAVNMRSKHCLFWAILIASAELISNTTIATAQGIPAPAANQAFLYEMSEDAVLLNSEGHLLVPDPSNSSPTGLVDATNGAFGIPAIRRATSQLQGVAALGSALCPTPTVVTYFGDGPVMSKTIKPLPIKLVTQSSRSPGRSSSPCVFIYANFDR